MMDDLLRQHFVGWDGYTWWSRTDCLRRLGRITFLDNQNQITPILGFSEEYRVGNHGLSHRQL